MCDQYDAVPFCVLLHAVEDDEGEEEGEGRGGEEVIERESKDAVLIVGMGVDDVMTWHWSLHSVFVGV